MERNKKKIDEKFHFDLDIFRSDSSMNADYTASFIFIFSLFFLQHRRQSYSVLAII